jgi:hypothetical protein
MCLVTKPTPTIGCGSHWKHADTRMTERGGCLANLGYVGTTDAIFTKGEDQPDSPWIEDDPDGIYMMHTKSYH